MAIYRCAECDEFIDNDYHPGEEGRNPGDLVCPACVAMAEEEINGEDYRKPQPFLNYGRGFSRAHFVKWQSRSIAMSEWQCKKCGSDSKCPSCSRCENCDDQYHSRVMKEMVDRYEAQLDAANAGLEELLWNEIKGIGSLPDDPGKYLCAFSDGTVETFNIDEDDLARGGWACDTCRVTHWAEHPEHPEAKK